LALTQEVSELKGQFEQFNKQRLADIKGTVSRAESLGKLLSKEQLDSYKQLVENLPPSVPEYWITVASIINYQSWANQKLGSAPDPAAVSRHCTASGIHNIYAWSDFSGCVVYLDQSTFDHVTFTNSVIHYAGGPVRLNVVTFTNCRFIIDTNLPTQPQKPAFLRSLLASDQMTVNLNGI
jgi:hypothetical protein